ncbi:hypothetical protein FGO68_gene15123 [Halteria grandinella]|uniref:Uncharacterized protein n=1 Tax=Halteria grandinella TaxID=5974 RepID=A0A8J8NYA4_HALGN|nr:hypothetical protein FGO68_gene15123 [Halteria grandinella]
MPARSYVNPLRHAPNIKSSIQRVVEDVDAFGVPISLTYKRQTHIKSFVGGLFTLLAYGLIAAFFFYQCKSVITREYGVEDLTIKRNLQNGTDMLNITQTDFDFGVKVDYLNKLHEPEVQANIEEYIELTVSQEVSKWVYDYNGEPVHIKDKTFAKLGSCDYGRLGLVEGIKNYLFIRENYYCAHNFTFQLQGSSTGQLQKYIVIDARACNQTSLNIKYNNTKKCKPQSEILRVASLIKLYFVVENSYFDDSIFDHGHMVKKYLKPYYFSAVFNSSTYYYMSLIQNQIEAHDHWLYASQNVGEAQSFETIISYNGIEDLRGEKDEKKPFVTVNVMLDEAKRYQQRKVDTITDAFTTTGGIITIIMALFAALTQHLQSVNYFSKLIQSFYYYDSTILSQRDIKNKGRQGSSQDFHQSNRRQQSSSFHSKTNTSIASLHTQPITDFDPSPNSFIFSSLLQEISNRKHFVFSVSEYIKSGLRRLFTFSGNVTEVDAFQDKLKLQIFKKGSAKIEDDLDIRKVFHALTLANALGDIILKKDQRQLLKYTKYRILKTQKIDEFADGDDDRFSAPFDAWQYKKSIIALSIKRRLAKISPTYKIEARIGRQLKKALNESLIKKSGLDKRIIKNISVSAYSNQVNRQQDDIEKDGLSYLEQNQQQIQQYQQSIEHEHMQEELLRVQSLRRGRSPQVYEYTHQNRANPTIPTSLSKSALDQLEDLIDDQPSPLIIDKHYIKNRGYSFNVGDLRPPLGVIHEHQRISPPPHHATDRSQNLSPKDLANSQPRSRQSWNSNGQNVHYNESYVPKVSVEYENQARFGQQEIISRQFQQQQIRRAPAPSSNSSIIKIQPQKY